MKKIGLIYLLFLLPQFVFSQSVDTHLVVNFSQSETLNHSQIKHVFAADEYFLVTGNVQKETGKPTIFVAAYDYEANLIWTKYLSVPESTINYNIRTYENIKRMPNGNYSIGAEAMKIIAGDTICNPFLYVFNGIGDSVRFIQFESDVNVELGAVNQDNEGNILIGGVAKPYSLSNKREEWPDDLSEGPYLWIGKVQNDYIHSVITNEGLRSKYSNFSSVRNIYQLDNNDQYVVSGFLYMGTTAFLQTQYFDLLGNYLYNYNFLNIVPDHVFYPQSMLYPLNDLMVQKSRYDSNKMLHGYITGRRIGDDDINYQSLVFGNLNKTEEEMWEDYHTAFNFMVDDYEYQFMHNGMLKIREAYNGDILAVKANITDLDSLYFYDYMFDPPIGSSIFIRTDDKGNEISHQFIEKFPIKPEYSSAQIINDLDQRRDGKKIILVGSIEAENEVIGKWDKIGKTSWIVIMSDTTTPIPLGINPTKESTISFDINPNPATNELLITIDPSAIGKLEQYFIIDLYGKVTAEGRINNSGQKIDIGSLVPGIYFIRLVNKDGVQTAQKFVKL